MKVQDKFRHPDCFVCAECEENLKQKGYYFIDDELYCETHAHARAKPPESPDLWPSHCSFDYMRAQTTSQLLSAWSCFNHRHIVLPQFMHNHVTSCQDTCMDSALLCHVWWDAVFCTYFIGIGCVDWNMFVWIKVLFLENHNISHQVCLSRKGEHFPDTWNIMSNKTQNKWFCVFITAVMFDVPAGHMKNLLIQ